jgi:hypothetical protein
MESKQQFRVMGVNDDVDYCGHCGKTGLKRVVWLAPVDADGTVCGEAAPYGTTCAWWALNGEKLTRSNARIEREISARLQKSVDDYITKLRTGWVVLGQYLVPSDSDFSKPTSEILTARDARYPVLGYLNGKLTITQAARLMEGR